MDRYTFGGEGTNVPHELGMAAPPGTTGPCRCDQPYQVWPHLPRATSSVPIKSFPTCTTWMNKIDRGNIGLIEWMKL
jgi:hypothetical protein